MKHLDGLKRPFVEVDGNKLTIAVQDGSVLENGVNGIQALDMISIVYDLFSMLNEDFPCDENEDTIYYLTRAYSKQAERTRDRTNRGVEGKEEL